MIEPTPTLSGKNADDFLESIANARYSKQKEKFLQEAEQAYIKYIKN